MKTIGGFFELELPKGKEYHRNVIRLNTGRNAFEYILRAKAYKKVFLPFFTCNVMLEPVHKMELDYEFYHIDEKFRPIFDFSSLQTKDVFVYTNYFGICDKQVEEIAKSCQNLIIDNSQAFFSMPLQNVDTIYSPRKFFGLPDGAYLYTNKFLRDEFEKDISFNRFEHLLGRIDVGAEVFYKNFKNNEDSLIGQSIKSMSNLTQRILESIDYISVAKKRRDNFRFFHNALNNSNKLKLDDITNAVPMVYPYWSINGLELKKTLIERKIFVPTYWPNVITWSKKGNLEIDLAEGIIPLPIDQRFSDKELNFIISTISSNGK